MKWKFRNMMETTEPVFARKMLTFCVESIREATSIKRINIPYRFIFLDKIFANIFFVTLC